ncbi:Putative PLP-dependent aminotransferase (plasmid) [Sodalis praecaptivus]|uniref:Putative PLP-dependent aminotransferase n=1 Tax=Sodalis praecaptivus TaxID=1239307 RepID=W0I3G5_9GAMM|nr:hypothetical protein [Sodalis praecaptivus]AHF79292.1 Putative PLP-dependent aminotransferase [Sodalis praecaptivus]
MQDNTLQHLNSPEDKEEIYNKLCSASALMEEARSGIAFLDEVKEDLPSAKQRLIYLCFWVMIVRTVSKALEVSMLSEDLYRIYLVSRGRKAQKYFKMIIFDKCEQTYVYSAIGTYMPNIFAMYQNNIDIDKYEGEELIQWVLSVIKKELEKMIISSHGMTQSRSDIVVDLIHYTQENIQLFSVYRNNAIINEETQFTLGERYIVDFATAGDVDVEDNPNGVDNNDNFFYLGESIGAGLGVGATVFGLSGTWSENGIVSTIIDKVVGLVNTMGGIGAGLFNSLAKIEDLDKIQEEGAAFMVDVSDIVLRAESIPMNEGFGLMNMLQYQKIETLIKNVVSERTKLLIKMNEALGIISMKLLFIPRRSKREYAVI